MPSELTSFVKNLKNTPSEIASGPGALLRQAREGRGISIDQIASQLKLSSKMTEALENDDYSHINSLIFLKGYLRNYAKIVNIPADDVIAQINTRQFEQNRERPPQIEYKIRLFTREQLMRWMTLGLGILLVGFILNWWHSHSQNTPITLLPATHTEPLLPKQPSEVNDFESNTPLYEDVDPEKSNEIVDDVTPAQNPTREQPKPVESFADKQASALKRNYNRG